MMRPRGRPPMPSAMSRPSEPVETTSISSAASFEPSFMIEPLPNARSICPRAASNAFCLSISALSNRRRTVCDIARSPYSIGLSAMQRASLYMFCSGTQWEHLLTKPISGPAGARPDAARHSGTGTQIGDSPRVSARLIAPRLAHDFLHLEGKLLEREGLGEEMDVGIVADALAKGILGVARDEDDLHVGSGLAHLLDQGWTVHARHHHVGDDEMDRFRLGLDDLQRRLAALRLEHGVALVPERPGAEQADRILVLDQQDGAGAGQVARCRHFERIEQRRRLRLALLALMLRQIEREFRADAHLAVDEDEAAGLLHDAVDGREAEAGAGPHFLGREEWFEDSSDDLARDAGALVGDLDQHIGAGGHELELTLDRLDRK